MSADTAFDLTADLSVAARRTSTVLAVLAGAALAGNCLLNSPGRFSEAHEHDTSWLKPVVSFLAMGGELPTYRGVEIRNLIFYAGAAVLVFVAGLRLLTGGWRRPPASLSRHGHDRANGRSPAGVLVTAPRLTTPTDSPGLRQLAANPLSWWFVFLLVSALSTSYSHAPDVCRGQMLIHVLWLAWWLPLAAFLLPRHGCSLARWLACVIIATALLALWYDMRRPQPRLKYPMGNELWLAACLLPGLFLILGDFIGWALRVLRPSAAPSPPQVASAGRPAAPLPPPASDVGQPAASHPLSVSTAASSDASSSPPASAAGQTAAAAPASAAGACGASPDAPRPRPRRLRTWLVMLAGLVAAAAIVAALYATRSRSAAAGVAAGVAAVVWLGVPRRARPYLLVAGVLCLLGLVAALRDVGLSGARSHSVRARLNYEWPYAVRLFAQAPIIGHGDGAYSMLAGQFAREEQLEDPAILSFDEWSWVGHAHNEFLELLADLGALGCLAFVAAIGATLLRAQRCCDGLRAAGADPATYGLLIGLTGAFVAMLIEECSSVALRTPGLPPILLTIWAIVWALSRQACAAAPIPCGVADSQGPSPEPFSPSSDAPTVPAEDGAGSDLGDAPDDAGRSVQDDDSPVPPASSSLTRLVGTAFCIAAVLLARLACHDWQAARAAYEATTAMQQEDYRSAIENADAAAANVLDPFQRMIARVHAVWARSLWFDALLRRTSDPPTDTEIEVSRQALARLARLRHDAPRFLRVSSLQADLCLNLSRAHERRGESAYGREFRTMFEQALVQRRADEPFRIDAVQDLWRALPEASAVQRLLWLRCLLRFGEMPTGFVELVHDLGTRPDFVPAINDLFNVAAKDAASPGAAWTDELSPETFRAAALSKALAGQPDEAAKLAARAALLYEAAGQRLFAAHAAALHEQVRYGFTASPCTGSDARLALLAQADTLLGGVPRVASTPLANALGQTRLRLLLANGREEEAIRQLRRLQGDDSTATSEKLAPFYVELASRFSDRLDLADAAVRWSRRATELVPDVLDAHVALINLLLRTGDDAAALEAVERCVRSVPDGKAVRENLSALQNRYPGSSVWRELRRRRATSTAPAVPG